MINQTEITKWDLMDESETKLKFFDLSPVVANTYEEVLLGLSAPSKKLHPKLFYDQKGSDLFDQICRVNDYYLTRTEKRIIRENASRIAKAVGADRLIIEYGAGNAAKAQLILDLLERPFAYMPVDISREYLLNNAQALAQMYRDLWIFPVCADFTFRFELPEFELSHFPTKKRVGLFLGSTLGNLERPEALEFLKNALKHVREGGALLIGLDLAKDVATLERAYNDSEGLTAKFNLNLLCRLNQELGTDFDLSAFKHSAFYNYSLKRIEMHLVSLKKQKIHLGDSIIQFEEGETIHTENSHKYTSREFTELAQEAGFTPIQYWTDPDHYYAIHYLQA